MADAKRKTRAAKPATSEPQDDSALIEVEGFGHLTEKQRRFCIAYRQRANATQAALDAGYEAGDRDLAGKIGSKLLGNWKVLCYLAFLARDDDISTSDVTSHLMREGLGADHAGARVRALELVGKSRGMFADFENAPNRLTDEALAVLIAGDDPAMRELLMKRLRGE